MVVCDWSAQISAFVIVGGVGVGRRGVSDVLSIIMCDIIS